MKTPTLSPCLALRCLPVTGVSQAGPFRPNDPLFLPDAAGRHDGQWHLRVANFPAAWESGATIPKGTLRAFSVKGGAPLEEVEIFVEVRHWKRGELSAVLESPSGTERELFRAHSEDRGEDIIWIFTTHAFCGEEPRGVWKLTLLDSVAGETGRWESFAWRMRMGEPRIR